MDEGAIVPVPEVAGDGLLRHCKVTQPPSAHRWTNVPLNVAVAQLRAVFDVGDGCVGNEGVAPATTIRKKIEDRTSSRTSKTAVGPGPVTISLEAGVTLVILALSLPNILFILRQLLECEY